MKPGNPTKPFSLGTVVSNVDTTNNPVPGGRGILEQRVAGYHGAPGGLYAAAAPRTPPGIQSTHG